MVFPATALPTSIASRFLEFNPNPVLILGRDAQIVYANGRARTCFSGLDHLTATHPVLAGILPNIVDLNSHDAALVVFAREISHAGATYDQQMFSAPGEDCVYVFMTDISERKKAERETRQAQAQLEERVRARTAELSRSNKDLEEFAYAASHDLRSPLRAIKQLAEWLSESVAARLHSGERMQLELLLARTERLDKLIEDLLEYSKAGRRIGRIRMVNAEELLEEIVECVGIPPGFQVLKTSSLPRFQTAAVPLQQVLRNLIANAIKHHDRKCGQVRVSAKELGSFFEFTVSDDGPGIPPRFHERVFQLFETLRPRDDVEGSGMGLALVKRTVEAAGGTVTLESDGCRGTTIRFTWPALFPAPSESVASLPSDE